MRHFSYQIKLLDKGGLIRENRPLFLLWHWWVLFIGLFFSDLRGICLN